MNTEPTSDGALLPRTPCSPSSLTPESDAMLAADLHHLEDDETCPASAYWRMTELARTLERERDEWRKKAVAIHKQKEELECRIIAYKSMCGAAAHEIEGQWEAHMDKDGYGPSNLMYRLRGQSPPDIYPAHVTHEERSKWMKWRTGEILPENAGAVAPPPQRPASGKNVPGG